MKMSFVKNALAALALIGGTLFTSCSQEDLDTTFTPGAAKVTINVNVYNALTGEEVSGDAAIELSDAGYSRISGSSLVSFSKEYENGVTAGTTVNVTATLGSLSKTEQVTLGNVKQGGTAQYHVNIILLGDKFEMELKENVSTVTYPVESFQNAHGHTMSHDGSMWFENASEYFLPVSINYTYPDNVVLKSTYANMELLDMDDYLALEAMFQAMEKEETFNGTYSYTASAWSLSRPTVEVTKTTSYYSFKSVATGLEVFTATLEETYADCVVAYEEIAHPSHSSHYSVGHGHAHGSDNAGGGIVVAD